MEETSVVCAEYAEYNVAIGRANSSSRHKLFHTSCYDHATNFRSEVSLVRYFLMLLAAVVATSISSFAQWPPAPGHTTLNIWPHAAPGSQPNPAPEGDTTTAKENLVAGKPLVRLGNVSTPTLTLYTPSGKNTGAAVVVFPGGSYRILAIDLEGTEVCDWLNSIGITCVLLKYRVPDTGPYPKSAAALQDAQRTLGIVRSHAAEWHIDPKRIGVLGFSAGAHLAAALSTHFEKRLYDAIDAADQVSCRPDFAVIVYPGYLAIAEQNFASNADIHPTEKTPPSIIVQTEDDPVHVENSTVYFLALKNAKVPAELHLYAQGGHGYGLRRTELPVTAWPQLVETWLRTIQVLPPTSR
jgi:acetyl esterase/lipase